MKNSEAVRFMIVDDDEISVRAIQRSIKKQNISNSVMVATDGVDALQQLDSFKSSNKPLPPFIITLDLKMPRMGGLEFLEHIRNDEAYKRLVVFVLTTSNAPSDINTAYGKNVAGYIVKENPTETLKNTMALLKDYANLVVLPN